MVSIIIVNYKVKKELFKCIKSIISSKPKNTYEIIVIDNDEVKTISTELKKLFPNVKYIPNKNKGFGQGNNIGAIKARGEYLFFLNPDTVLFSKTVDILVSYLKRNHDTGIIAPLLFDDNYGLYQQGANELTPTSAIFSFSIIHKLFPNNPIAKKYWMDNWDKKNIKAVASVPGTAFVIRKEIFKKINGFDENFFMYFEEQDLCKRVRELGWKIIMHPKAKVIHSLGKSSRQVEQINTIFQQSRFYYFKKHFGYVAALLTESVMRTGKNTILLLSLLALQAYILFYKLPELMLFIGDQGWFYLSARDMILKGEIPLVGIESSRPWLHQGALWTYMLAAMLSIFQFNPLSGAYLAILFGLLATILVYIVGSQLFSTRVGLIAVILYAMSPLILHHARTPYHTAPVPLLTLLFVLAMYKWLQGREIYLPVIIMLLGILYNFEIATFLLTIVFFVTIVYGVITKKQWIIKALNPKIIIFAFVGFLIPMLPMLIYDISHGFPQTIKFLVWFLYKIATVLGYPEVNPDAGSTDFRVVLFFIAEYYKRAVYYSAGFVAFTIALFSFGFFYSDMLKRLISRKHDVAIYLIGLVTTVSISGIIATRTTSEAYLPILFPLVIIITALFFNTLINLRPRLKFIVWLIIAGIAGMNLVAFVTNNTLIQKGIGLKVRVDGAKQIVTESNGRSYNLRGVGSGSNFKSYTMNYEYLTWWLGNGPSEKPQPVQFIISEDDKGIIIRKIESK